MPTRIQRTRTNGKPGMPPGALYVGRGRGSRWHNPFAVVKIKTGWRLIDTGRRSRTLVDEPQTFAPADKPYALLMAGRLFRLHTSSPNGLYHYGPATLERLRRELAGRDLACWCPLPAPGETDWCHAAHLLTLANL